MKIERLDPGDARPALPAVKIGRFGVCQNSQSGGIGSETMSFLKIWFIYKNKTGCRFIVVDASNNPRTIKFYRNNGFKFLSGNDVSEKTRIMFFDLKPWINYVYETMEVTSSTINSETESAD